LQTEPVLSGFQPVTSNNNNQIRQIEITRYVE